MIADPPRVARSGRSFDFAGVRVRLEGSARAADDRVPELVEYIVDAIRLAQLVDAQHGNEHTIELTDSGWTIAHPLAERLDGSLFDCTARWRGDDTGERGRFVLIDGTTLGERLRA